MKESTPDRTYSHILIIDDDAKIRQLLGQYLQDKGFYVSLAEDANVARDYLQRFVFDLLIVDIMLPGESGYAFTTWLRQHHTNIPVIMLTAMGETEDRIQGLEAGADDYLAKPFEPRELILRIKTILKRSQGTIDSDPQWIGIGALRYNTQNGELRRGDERLSLTSAEIQLMNTLAAKAGQTVSREELSIMFNNVNERTIDVQITRLRQKIENDPKNPLHLQSVRGKGYVLYIDG